MIEKNSHLQTKIIFLFATLALLFLSFMSYIRIKNLIVASDWVRHTQIVKLEVEKTFSILNEAESSQRGFMLTKDPVFLNPVLEADTNLQKHLDITAALTKDNPVQQQNVATLRVAVFKRLNYLKNVLEDSKTSTITPARLLVGKALMDEVDKQVATLEKEEVNLLATRSALLDNSTFVTPLFSVFLIMGSVIILVAAYFKIIQELKKSDRLKYEIINNEMRLQTILHNAPDAVITIDENGIVMSWNPHAEIIFGWKEPEVLGKTLGETIIPERYRQQHINGMKNFLKTGEGPVINKAVELSALNKDKTEFPIELKISSSKINGHYIFIGFIRDITIRQQAAEALKNKNSELEQSNKELESFNYISSHDLQEPLRQIQNFASRISSFEEQNLSDKGKDYFTKINKAANRMQVLIADLLSYSRTKTADRKLEMTDLNEIVKDVVVEFNEIIEEKHATIEVRGLSPANVIPFQFRQMVHNLIGNALKFSKSDIPPHIVIKNRVIAGGEAGGASLDHEKSYCHFTISDNGIGFEPEYKDRIFEVFQRLHDKQKFQGTGIGLAIVKKIIENHNGTFTATSQLNEGATFDIYFPTS